MVVQKVEIVQSFINHFVNKTDNSSIEQNFEPAMNRNLYGFLCNFGIEYIFCKFLYLSLNDNLNLSKHCKCESTISETELSIFEYVGEH